MSVSSTLLLYIIITAITTLFSYLSDRAVIGAKQKIRADKLLLTLSFLIHWIFYCFTNIGADYVSYTRLIRTVTFSNRQGLELGSTLVFIILRNVFRSPDIGVFVYKTIFLIIFYRCLWLRRDKQYLWLFVFTFNVLLYLNLFVVIRMTGALALFTLSIIYLLDGKNGKALIFIIAACFIHYTAILMIPAYLVYFIFKRNGHKLRVGVIFIAILVVALVVSRYANIYNFIMGAIPWLEQNKSYGLMGDYLGSGFAAYIIAIPLCLFALEIYFYSEDDILTNISAIFTIYAVFWVFMGYRINVLARMNYYSYFLSGICIPTYFRNKSLEGKGRLNADIGIFIFCIYLLLRYYLILHDISSATSLARINSFSFYWPF